MEWKTIAEDSAKKAKTQQRRQEIPSLSVMTQLDVDVLWLGITRKPGNEHILRRRHTFYSLLRQLLRDNVSYYAK
jgi:hypothetical protein